MISVVAIWTVLPGCHKKAKAALRRLAKKVEKTEPDTWMYLPHSSNMKGFNNPVPNDGQITFVEVYKDQEAFDYHLYGPNGQEDPSGTFVDFVNKYSDLFLCNQSDGQPYMHVLSLDLIDGFVRKEMTKI